MPRQSISAWLALVLLAAWLAWAVAGGPVFSPLNGREAPPAVNGHGPAPGAGSGSDAGTEGGCEGGRETGEEVPPAPVAVTKEGWGVVVDVAAQKVYVYRDGKPARAMVCSTGTPDKPTPLGEFRIENRGTWFFSEKYKQGGKWWVSFHNWGEYLFHSVPMDREGRILEEEAGRLGQPASHGCVRLSLKDAEWFYLNIPPGTPVIIH
ncbi:MAG: L,D-transpeptidase [Bacillota bacterium]|nr:L,D-transpeptidase [Bacillota bacterium]